MKEITRKNIEAYMRKELEVDPDQVFNPEWKHDSDTFDIQNDTLKEFTGCWVEKSTLIIDDSENVLRNHMPYNNDFSHLNSMDEFVCELQKINQLKKERAKQFTDYINHIKSFENKGRDKDDRDR